MLNEPRGGDTAGEGAEAQGSPHTNYIQVTPQEKEAIERVSSPLTLTLQCRDLAVSLLSPTELYSVCLGLYKSLKLHRRDGTPNFVQTGLKTIAYDSHHFTQT